jgi:hypothetical protein
MEVLNLIEHMRETGHTDTEIAGILLFLLSYVLYEEGDRQSKVFDQCFALILDAGVLRDQLSDHAM